MAGPKRDALMRKETSTPLGPAEAARLRELETTRAVIASAGAALPADLQRELDDLLQRRVAAVSPVARASGAVVHMQTGGTVVGEVYGDVYTGEVHHHQHKGVEADRARAMSAYHAWVAEKCERTRLRMLAPEDSDGTNRPDALDLARVYVALDSTTTTPSSKKSTSRQARPERQLPVVEVMASQRCLVVLGQPGSGKSTLVSHTALCLARARLEPSKGWHARIDPLCSKRSGLVPVVVSLRDLAAAHGGEPPAPEASVLTSFIEACLKRADLREAIEPLRDALDAGRGVVLLDGLDEVPTREGRTWMQEVVAAFVRRYRKCRYVVTCRVLTWVQEPGALEGFKTTEIAPFDTGKIARFALAWHAELVNLGRLMAEDASRLGTKLQRAIRSRPGLEELAGNPLILTVMAVVQTKGRELPEGEAPLYKEAVEVLLWRWHDAASAQSPHQLLEKVGAKEVELREALCKLAFDVHRTMRVEQRGLADILEADVTAAVVKLDPDESNAWARRLVGALKLRAGLLVEREPGVYTFLHRTFQELLAAWHLSAQQNFEEEATKLLVEDPARWRRVVLLAVGLLDADARLAGIRALLVELLGEDKDTPAAWRRAWWAGEVLDTVGPDRLARSDGDKAQRSKIRRRLRALVEGGKLAPSERVEAGRVLGRIGDPRFDPALWHLPAGGHLGFVRIPAGRFWMGSDRKRDKLTVDNERPRHEVHLPELWLCRYPATVAQWRAFVRECERAPKYDESLAGADNEPVRWVTWDEADAFATWLDEALRSSARTPAAIRRLLSDGYGVRLPSEAEWEKAARGTEGRIWPWGNEFDAKRANTAELGLGNVSPVGSFPEGATPEGLHDMAGNVWEWTRSVFKDYPYVADDGRESSGRKSECVLRGGMYGNNHWLVRCAHRLHGVAVGWREGVGFRLALTHPDSDR